ncbi:MAG: hypothetical protein J1E37_06880 [Prevotella sp.]|nr:hypothetical protein [Prevotella sp.]
MKKVLLFCTCVLMSVNLMAQSGHRGIDVDVDFGYNFNTKSSDFNFLSATATFGKRFSRNLYAGVGAGAYLEDDVFKPKSSPGCSVPIFADIRGYWPVDNTNMCPFLGIRAGYAINANGGSDSVILQITPGVQIPLSSTIDLKIAAGYEHWISTQQGVDDSGVLVIRVGIGLHKK